jgi:hypothetical protein
MRHLIHFSALALALISATSVSAQTVAQPSLGLVPSFVVSDSVAPATRDSSIELRSDIAPAGAPTTGLRAGVHSRETARSNQPYVVQSQHMGQDKAMMVVGVAALITGAIIGGSPGTIVMVGGAVVGLMGLYNYLE